MTDVKYEWIYKKCVSAIQDFASRNSTEPKYILINRNTFDKLSAYVNKVHITKLAWLLPSRNIYFCGVKLRFADIEDDEVVVGG